jgi:hypothetical protein
VAPPPPPPPPPPPRRAPRARARAASAINDGPGANGGSDRGQLPRLVSDDVPHLSLVAMLLLLLCCQLEAYPAAVAVAAWMPLEMHVFVDTEGLTDVQGLSLTQHAPAKTYEMAVLPDKPWDGGGPQHGAIAGYCSVVQVSEHEIRIYYDTFGQYGRFLCVAVSEDGGKTFRKPSLGLVEFGGSTANNIIAGKPLNSSSLRESIEPGTVFIDARPGCPETEKFKMVMTWRGGATMFASADGYDFRNMTAEPLLHGSDTQDVVFWDPRVNAYVYYGRSHLRGGQNVTCASASTGSIDEPARSINHFVIGQDVTKWPYDNANVNATALTILNTDSQDPPCIDIYTNVATVR